MLKDNHESTTAEPSRRPGRIALWGAAVGFGLVTLIGLGVALAVETLDPVRVGEFVGPIALGAAVCGFLSTYLWCKGRRVIAALCVVLFVILQPILFLASLTMEHLRAKTLMEEVVASGFQCLEDPAGDRLANRVVGMALHLECSRFELVEVRRERQLSGAWMYSDPEQQEGLVVHATLIRSAGAQSHTEFARGMIQGIEGAAKESGTVVSLSPVSSSSEDRTAEFSGTIGPTNFFARTILVPSQADGFHWVFGGSASGFATESLETLRRSLVVDEL